MENPSHCPLEIALQKVVSSAKTSKDLANALFFLQKTISNLLTHPNDRRYATIEKENEVFAQKLFSWVEVQEFLNITGFREKNGAYEYIVCDEGMKILEAALKILNHQIQSSKLSHSEEKPYFELWKDGHYLKNSRILIHDENQSDRVYESKGRRAKVQDMLSRHRKQETLERDGLLNWKKNECLEAPFSAEGYFYQACPKKDNRKKKCFYEEMFDKHDFNNNKKGCAFFPFLKLG